MITVTEAMDGNVRWALNRGYDPYNSASHFWWEWLCSIKRSKARP